MFWGLIVMVLVVSAQQTWAIPSPLDHVHTNPTVHWKEGGSPALPWTNATANTNDHNHLTADSISNGGKWIINKAWDNRTVRFGDDFAHGMILSGNEVRYGWGAGIPDKGKDAVEGAYDDWIAKATTQFNAEKDPWDKLAIDFDRVNAGAKEITVSFNAGLADYGLTTTAVGGTIIEFLTQPTFQLKTVGGLKQTRLGNAGVSGTQITVPVDWSFDGTPAAALTDFDYSVDGGANWTDAPPVGFGNLDWGGASFGHVLAPADEINVFEMDFFTIARHEIGHSIALGHTGADLTAILRTDIADFALFGNTMAIDNDSALAVAIDYTYAVPEPATLVVILFGGFVFIRRR